MKNKVIATIILLGFIARKSIQCLCADIERVGYSREEYFYRCWSGSSICHFCGVGISGDKPG